MKFLQFMADRNKEYVETLIIMVPVPNPVALGKHMTDATRVPVKAPVAQGKSVQVYRARLLWEMNSPNDQSTPIKEE